MANKFSIFILGLLLLGVTHLNAAPHSVKSSEESKEEVFPKPVLERFKILLFTLEEFGSLFVELSNRGPEIFKAVLKDPKVVEDKSEEMQKYVKELRDYIKKTDEVKKDQEKDETFDMFEDYFQILEKFDSDKNKNLSPAALVIEKSLEENGLGDIKKTAIAHFEKFFKKFNTELEEYFKGLDEKEMKEEKEFKEWFDKLQAEKDIEKKIQIFDNFVGLDDSKESD